VIATTQVKSALFEVDQNYRGVIAQSSDAWRAHVHLSCCYGDLVLMELTSGGGALIGYSLVLLLFRLGCRWPANSL